MISPISQILWKHRWIDLHSLVLGHWPISTRFIHLSYSAATDLLRVKAPSPAKKPKRQKLHFIPQKKHIQFSVLNPFPHFPGQKPPFFTHHTGLPWPPDPPRRNPLGRGPAIQHLPWLLKTSKGKSSMFFSPRKKMEYQRYEAVWLSKILAPVPEKNEVLHRKGAVWRVEGIILFHSSYFFCELNTDSSLTLSEDSPRLAEDFSIQSSDAEGLFLVAGHS